MDNYFNDNLKAKAVYQDGIHFPSKGENDLYNILLLYKHHYDLDVHKKILVNPISNKNWAIDFTLYPKSYKADLALKNLLLICNGCESPVLEAKVYIEYKGYMDKNFISHMQEAITCGSRILPNLILISKQPSAYVQEDVHSKNRYIKMITSLAAFRTWMYDVHRNIH